MATNKRLSLARQKQIREYGLFFSDDLLHMPIPSQEQMDNAREIQPRDFDDLHAMRMGPKEARLKARDRMLRRHRRLVIYFAKKAIAKCHDPAIEIGDLINEGMLGFLYALEKGDYTTGAKFMSYAAICIKGHLSKTLDRCGAIRISETARSKIRSVTRLQKSRSHRHKRHVGFFEAAKAFYDGDEEKALELWKVYKEVMRVSRSRLRLKGSRRDFGESNSNWIQLNFDAIEDTKTLRPDEALEEFEFGAATRRCLAQVSPRQEKVIRMHYGIGEKDSYSFEEIGQDFHLSRERIRQIEAIGMRRLQHPRRMERLIPFTPSYPNDHVIDLKVPIHGSHYLTDTDSEEAELVRDIVYEYLSDDDQYDKIGVLYHLLMKECAWSVHTVLSYIMSKDYREHMPKRQYADLMRRIGSIAEAIDYELQFMLDDLSKIIREELEDLS